MIAFIPTIPKRQKMGVTNRGFRVSMLTQRNSDRITQTAFRGTRTRPSKSALSRTGEDSSGDRASAWNPCLSPVEAEGEDP
jgi:hypothetical protein